MSYVAAYCAIGLLILARDLIVNGERYANSARYRDRKIAIIALLLAVILWPLHVFARTNQSR